MTASDFVLNSPDLLGEIFLSCLPEPKDDDDLPGRLPYEAPVILTHVNKRWRDVALAYRRLWCRLCLCFRRSTFPLDDGLKVPCAILCEWLKRSSPLPFSLKVNFDPDDARFYCPYCMTEDTALNEILVKHSHRWEVLQINMICPPFQLLLQSLATLELPALKRTIALADSHANTRPLCIRDAPKLETLYLTGQDVSTNRFLVDDRLPPNLQYLILRRMSFDLDGLYTTNITRLVFDDTVISLDNFVKFPYFFPLLEELTVTYDEVEAELGELHSSVVLENLRFLETESAYDFPVKYMIAPKLSRLQVNKAQSPSDDHLTFATVLSFLKRSTTRLNCLRNNGISMTNDEFAALLDMASDLQILEVTDTPISFSMLHALAGSVAQNGTDHFRCPKLLAFQCDFVLDTEPSNWMKTSRMHVEMINQLLQYRAPANGYVFQFLGYPFIQIGLDIIMRQYHSICPDFILYSTRDYPLARLQVGRSWAEHF